MARPRNCRRIHGKPDTLAFKPVGVPASACEQIELGLDEIEAIRLADVEGLYQEDAARAMNVSRQTFGRILTEARRKVARAIVEGNMLLIKGGEVEMAEDRQLGCEECGHLWREQFGTGRPRKCPECGSGNIHRELTGSRRGAGNACRRRRGFRGGGGAAAGAANRSGRNAK